MQDTPSGIIFRGIKPLHRLGIAARDLALIGHLTQMSLHARVPDCLTIVPPDPWPGDAQRGRDMIAGAFRFAGQTIEKDDLSWRPGYARDEWVAALHGFEWLRDLRSAGSDRARRMAREMVASWIETHQKPEQLIWRPDVVGARIASWIVFHDFFCASADEEFRTNYFTSLSKQARWLARAVPGGQSGLPLMKALKGLALGGLALENGHGRLEQAFTRIIAEIKAQVLPDGTHATRSPQQTFEFLQILVDLRAALMAARLDLPAEVQHAIDRIAPAVKFFRHADGALSQFNGGQEGSAHLIETTLMQSGAKGRAMRSLPHGGYERIQMGRASLVMDTGNAPPLHFGARMHAAPLAFEYSYGRDRVIVNCGSSAITGTWRELLRQTAAHTTITVDNRNAGLLGMAAHETRAARHEESGHVCVLDAMHTGYVQGFGLTHRRCVRLSDHGDTLSGEDVLAGRADLPFVARFHLHPSVQASVIKNGEEVLVRARSGAGWRFSASGLPLTVEESVYCDEGELPRKAQQVVLHGLTVAPETCVIWHLRREKI